MKYNEDNKNYTKIIAISIPTDLYNEMEDLAKVMQYRSRSRLYADALVHYKNRLLKKLKKRN